jgi:iron complex outermembrane receptor protein
LNARLLGCIRVTVIAVAGFSSSAALADEPSRPSEAASATEIVVRAPRREIPGTQTQVVGEPFIEKSGATNVGQVLEELPALHAASDSRGERVLSLQGFSQRQVAVFVDGVPVLVPYDGQLDLSKFPIDMIERITVVKGAAPVLYGPNGLGGAINLQTREPREKPWIRARSEGWYNFTRSSIAASGRAGDAAGVVGGSFTSVRWFPLSHDFKPLPNENGGRRDNSDRKDGSVAAKATLDLGDDHRLIVSASRFEGTFGVPPATRDLTVRYWRWTDWYASTIGAGHEYRGRSFRSEEMAYVSFVGNTLDGYDDNRYLTQRLPRALHSVYDDYSVGGFARTTWFLDSSRYEPKIRTWTGFKRDHHVSYDNTNPEHVTVATNLATVSASGEIDVVPRRLRANAGGQFDAELPDKAPSGPSPNSAAAAGPLGGITWFASDRINVTASAALRTRFPTLRERFSTVFGTRDPNPGLAPEHALNLGLDVGYRPVRELQVQAGLFDSEVRDLITTVIVAPQTEQQQNVGKARFLGAELAARFTPMPWLDLLAGGLVLRAKSGDDLDQAVEARPRQKGLAVVTVRPIPPVAVSLLGRWIGEQDYRNPNTNRWETLDGYGLIDGRVEWKILPELRSYLRMTNLLDANVEGRFSFPEAGRQVFVGVVGETPP